METGNNRHKGRVLALQILYACESRPEDNFIDVYRDTIAESELSDRHIEYAFELSKRVIGNTTELDKNIEEHTRNWELKRVAIIEKNILRIAFTELLYFKEVPAKVVINEAIELAKEYVSPEAGKFVNGVIDGMYKKTRKHK